MGRGEVRVPFTPTQESRGMLQLDKQSIVVRTAKGAMTAGIYLYICCNLYHGADLHTDNKFLLAELLLSQEKLQG